MEETGNYYEQKGWSVLAPRVVCPTCGDAVEIAALEPVYAEGDTIKALGYSITIRCESHGVVFMRKAQ